MRSFQNAIIVVDTNLSICKNPCICSRIYCRFHSHLILLDFPCQFLLINFRLCLLSVFVFFTDRPIIFYRPAHYFLQTDPLFLTDRPIIFNRLTHYLLRTNPFMFTRYGLRTGVIQKIWFNVRIFSFDNNVYIPESSNNENIN